MDVVTPIIHMNGTSAAELRDQLGEAVTTLERALKALREAAPNQRDYYPVDGLWEKARRQFFDRQDKLEEVLESLMDEYEAMTDHGEA